MAPPLGRKMIGRFGIGKLATYVLARKLTHISKRDGKYFAVTMDYTRIDTEKYAGLDAKNPVKLNVRELNADEAREALTPWLTSNVLGDWKVKLFGQGAKKSWTVAILSSLKDKANEIQPGMLKWILRTAMPLQDDFEVYLDGQQLLPTKGIKGRIKRWVLGKDIAELPKPASDKFEARVDPALKPQEDGHYGIYHPEIGRVTGYAEAYKETLTGGKSEELGRSHGFFVYVRGRLINITDEYFGIDSNALRHGTFSRFRAVVHIDKLDEELRSNRESVREGPLVQIARGLLTGIFNWVRSEIDKHDADETAGSRISRALANSPASLSRRPILDLARLALEGKARPKFIRVPTLTTESERKEFLANLQALALDLDKADKFVTEVEMDYGRSPTEGVAAYDAQRAVLAINASHPFVGAFAEDFRGRNLALELMAMAEVLLEASLYHAGNDEEKVNALMGARDELLRYLAKSSGRRTALMVAQALQDARNDEGKLEEELVGAFDSLGFEATPIGGPGKADGKAEAHLGVGDGGVPRRYGVSLEAKSKEKDGGKVSAKAVGIAAIARQRDDLNCRHAVVVGPDFPKSDDEKSALEKEIASNRELTKKAGNPRTITLIRIDDMARLVRLQPVKRLSLAKLEELFETCSMPEQAKAWIDKLEGEKEVAPPYAEVLEAIWEEQLQDPGQPVQFGALRVALRTSLKMTNQELRELCHALSKMAPNYVTVRIDSVELETKPELVLREIQSTAQLYRQTERSTAK